ncbi:MAG: MATE family efflux transporter [Muribaculaceae bacterium]|nr:MATE family efflux transporter [Muribaculaceae bacterium]
MSGEKSVRIDMVSGGLTGKIMAFALPLMASGILQQSFNAVDVAVVGRYCSSQAMAAVGSNGPIINILVNLFLGISVGANVVIANYIGRKNEHGIRRAINTTGFVALASGLILMLIGLTLARPILEMMNTPHDVIELAAVYLRIYFLGMPFMMAYNFGAAIMRSMGDTKRPFYSLVIAGVVNTALNLTLVIGLDMGVKGVAIATVASNAVNAGIILWLLRREQEPFRLRVRDIRVEHGELGKMLRIGVPAGVQGMVFSFSNIFIQSAINSFGSAAVAGSAAALNYEVYCYYIISSFSQAAVAFVSQNYGAGEHERCRKVFRICMFLAVAMSVAANALIAWQGKACAHIFTNDPEVVAFAIERLHAALLFQWIACSYEISGACLRGLGYSMTPTVITVFGTCVIRLGWVYYVMQAGESFGTLLGIYPVTWMVTGVAMLATYYLIERRVFATGKRSV